MAPHFAVALYVPMAELHQFIEKAKEISPECSPQVVYHCYDDTPRTSVTGTVRLDTDSVQPELIFNVGPHRSFFEMDGEDKLRGTGRYHRGVVDWLLYLQSGVVH